MSGGNVGGTQPGGPTGAGAQAWAANNQSGGGYSPPQAGTPAGLTQPQQGAQSQYVGPTGWGQQSQGQQAPYGQGQQSFYGEAPMWRGGPPVMQGGGYSTPDYPFYGSGGYMSPIGNVNAAYNYPYGAGYGQGTGGGGAANYGQGAFGQSSGPGPGGYY